MPETWATDDAGTETCSNCGAVYAVKLHRAPTRDSDYFDCQICKQRLRTWNDTEYPSFTLIRTRQDQ